MKNYSIPKINPEKPARKCRTVIEKLFSTKNLRKCRRFSSNVLFEWMMHLAQRCVLTRFRPSRFINNSICFCFALVFKFSLYSKVEFSSQRTGSLVYVSVSWEQLWQEMESHICCMVRIYTQKFFFTKAPSWR